MTKKRYEKKKIRQIAKVCHEVNKVYCESRDDFSQVSWEKAPKNIQNSAMNGVKHILENPLSTPEQSHENWVRFKKLDGWKYGKVKNAKKKTHPCMVPYGKLPKYQQTKDHLFHAIVKSMK